MMEADYIRQPAQADWERMSWCVFLVSVATSFLVLIEPAPTDAIFFLALIPLSLAGLRRGRLFGPVESAGIALYVVFSFVSMLFVIHAPFVAVRALAIEVYMLLIMVVTAYFVRHFGDYAFRMILLGLLVGGTIASVIGILAWLDVIPNGDIFFRDAFRARIRSTFKDPNVLGPYLVPSLLLMIWWILESPKRRLLAMLTAGVLASALVLTYSRGAWAHALLSIVVFVAALTVHRETKVAVRITILSGLAFFFFGVLLFDETELTTLTSGYFGQRLTLQSYDSDRFSEIAQGVRLIPEYPFGLGPNQAPYVYEILPHNTFVVFGLHNGVLALLGFCIMFLGSSLRCIAAVMRGEDGWLKYSFVLALLAGLFLLSNVVGSIHWRHMFLVMGLGYGTYTSNRFFAVRS